MFPPLTETSTPPTTPPPVSVAVPVMVITLPCTVEPAAGKVIVEAGAEVSVEAVAEYQTRLERPRLYPHIGEQIDHCLLQTRIRCRHPIEERMIVMLRIQPPRPLRRASPKNQGPTTMTIQGQTMGCRPRAIIRAVVKEITRAINRGGRQPNQTGRPKTVIEILIPLIADCAIRQGGGLSWRQGGDTSCCARSASCHPLPALLWRQRYSS